MLALAAAVHLPSLSLGFVGDDFEWWLAARTALEEPIRLIEPYGGFRPVNLWLLADSTELAIRVARTSAAVTSGFSWRKLSMASLTRRESSCVLGDGGTGGGT